MTLDDVLWEWAVAESQSSRYGLFFEGLPGDIRDVLRGGRREDLAPGDVEVVLDILKLFRGELLQGPIIDPAARWTSTTLSTADLAGLRLMAFPAFKRYCPSLRLGDFAAALEAGRPMGEISTAYAALRREFRPEARRGRPIAVRRDVDAPPILLEGLVRSCVLLGRGEGVDVLLGTCPGLDGWYLRGDPRLALV